ncbi:hypothetical protein [Streptomyces murinus]|uniref:hypothetical protein n=1 Tax=Streptomyces murinus TaxID=33900 RepID=UPI003F4527E5
MSTDNAPPRLLPYVNRAIPEKYYRLDARGPEDIFKTGFYSFGTGWDLARHVSDFQAYSPVSGFVSTSSDATNALRMFVTWKVDQDTLKKTKSIDQAIIKRLEEAWGRTNRLILLENGRKSLSPEQRKAQEELLDVFYGKEIKAWEAVAKLNEKRTGKGWVELWMYSMMPSPYFIDVENNLSLIPHRAKLAGKRAAKLAQHANEWAAPGWIPPCMIIEAMKVRFTLTKVRPGKLPTTPQAWRDGLVFDAGLDFKSNRGNGETQYNETKKPFNPFTDERLRYRGLIGYYMDYSPNFLNLKIRLNPGEFRDPEEYLGGSKFKYPENWEGENEYVKSGGPAYPYGRPENMPEPEKKIFDDRVTLEEAIEAFVATPFKAFLL